MKTPYDQLAKGLIQAVLEPAGHVETDAEIAGEVQHADAWFVPDQARVHLLAERGAIGRMGHEPAIFEPFSSTPGPDQVYECLRKQLTLHRRRVLEASRSGRRPPALPPALWVISPGRPARVLSGYAMEPMANWWPGIYSAQAENLCLWVLDLSSLPRIRDTLLLRLMGRRHVLAGALQEVARLTPGDWEWLAAVPRVVQLKLSLPPDEESQEAVMAMQDVYEQWERGVLQRGREEGLEKGLERGLERGRAEERELLARQFARRLGRPLTHAEQTVFQERFVKCGPSRLGDVVLDLAPVALEAWLADPEAG